MRARISSSRMHLVLHPTYHDFVETLHVPQMGEKDQEDGDKVEEVV